MHISKHNYAVELERQGNIVYFMNPPNQNIQVKNYTIIKINDYKNLYVIDYFLISNRYIDFCRLRFGLTQFYDLILLQLVRRICKANQIVIETIISFDPNLHGFLHKYPAKKKVFFIADQIQNTSQTRSAKRADVVVSVAEEILGQFRSINPNCLLVNHGINKHYEDFANENLQKLNSELLPDYNNKEINIGYIGNLLIPFLDEEGLKRIVLENPKVQFHFWGAYSAVNNNLLANYDVNIYNTIQYLKNNCTNTHFYGVKTTKEIIPELNKIDAFIYINSSLKDVNGGANSHKILEYLSTGKTIISTYLSYYATQNLFPLLQKGKEYTYVEEFNNSIKKLNVLNQRDLQVNRIQFVLKNTYYNNLNKILNYSTN